MSKNINKNVGSFFLPTVATYLVKDQVEKWGAKVVEDTFQNTMKIRFVYVVEGKMTTPSFLEVTGI